MFERLGNAEASAEYKFLKRAENLYLKAEEAAGKKFENGKIVSADDEEEEKEKTAENKKRKIIPLSESDLDEYLNAGNRRNKAKNEALLQGKKIILTTNEEIVSFIKQAIINKKDLPTTAYGKVPKYLAEDVKEYSDGAISLSNNYLELVPDDIFHAYKEHLNAKEEGDINLTEEDFENIPKYIESYDELVYAIHYKSSATKICISKKTTKGIILLIQVVSKSRRSLNFKNMFAISEEKYIREYKNKYKSSPNSRGSNRSNTSLHDGATSNIIISQNSEKSTTKGQFSLKENSSDAKNATPYTKAEAVEMVSGILTEFFSAPEYAGKIKNMSDAVKMAMSTLNGAEAGKRINFIC